MFNIIQFNTVARFLLASVVITILSFSFFLSPAHATTTPRLDQLVKDTQSNGFLNSEVLQRISCEDLDGHILDVTYSLSAISSIPGKNVKAVFRQQPISGEPTPIFVESSDVFVSGQKQDYVFTFESSIDVTSACSSPRTYFYLGLAPGENGGSNLGIYFYGSKLSTAYRDTFFDVVSVGASPLKDLYFIINGTAQVNHSPILEPIGDFMSAEGMIINISPSAVDIDGGPLSFSVNSLPKVRYIL